MENWTKDLIWDAERLLDELARLDVRLDKQSVDEALRDWYSAALRVVNQYSKVVRLTRTTQRQMKEFEAGAHRMALEALSGEKKSPTIKDIEAWIITQPKLHDEWFRLQEALDDQEVAEILLKEIKEIVKSQKDVLQTLAVSLRTGATGIPGYDTSAHQERIEKAKESIRTEVTRRRIK